MPYSAKQMYDLISDVASYPEFLPWCAATRVGKVTPLEDGSGMVMDSDMVISFKLFREKFGSRVTLYPDIHKIDVEYLDGPFRHLDNHWHAIDLEEGGCEVDFYVDFEFKSAILQSVIGIVFNEAMQRIVRAFEDRAAEIYATT